MFSKGTLGKSEENAFCAHAGKQPGTVSPTTGPVDRCSHSNQVFLTMDNLEAKLGAVILPMNFARHKIGPPACTPTFSGRDIGGEPKKRGTNCVWDKIVGGEI